MFLCYSDIIHFPNSVNFGHVIKFHVVISPCPNRVPPMQELRRLCYFLVNWLFLDVLVFCCFLAVLETNTSEWQQPKRGHIYLIEFVRLQGYIMDLLDGASYMHLL